MTAQQRSLPSTKAINRLSGVYVALAVSWIAWWLQLNLGTTSEPASVDVNANAVVDAGVDANVDADADADAVEAEAKVIYELEGEEACSYEGSKCFQLVFSKGLKVFPSHPGLVQAGLTLLELRNYGDGDPDAAIALIDAALADAKLKTRGVGHKALLLTERGLALRQLQEPKEALLALQAAAELSPTNSELRGEIEDCFNEVDAIATTQKNLHTAFVFAEEQQQQQQQQQQPNVTLHRLSPGRPLLSRLEGLLSKEEVRAVLELGNGSSTHERRAPIYCMPSLEVTRRMLADHQQQQSAAGTSAAAAVVHVSKADVLTDLRQAYEKRNLDSVCFTPEKSAELEQVLEHSTSVEYHYGHGHAVLHEIGARIEALMGLADGHGAGWMVTTYSSGSSGYAVHNDCGTGAKLDRIATVLVYLTDVAQDAGGATVFTNVQGGGGGGGGGGSEGAGEGGGHIRVQPRAGTAAIWSSMTTDGKCDPHATHYAEQVGAGSTKVILQRWYHHEASGGLDFAPPPPYIEAYLEGTPLVVCDGSHMCRKYNSWSNY